MTRRSLLLSLASPGSAIQVREEPDQISIETSALQAAVRKRGYVSGVYRQTFLDKKTGFRDPGSGLDIADWIMEPGSDEAWRDKLPPDLRYEFNTPVHGKRAKRIIEGPQICTKARELSPRLIRGSDFVAVRQTFRYPLAAPGKNAGSTWEQVIVFPQGRRYFVSTQRIHSANASDAMFLRVDMPGHVKHVNGDTFSEIYLSYHGRIPAREFAADFPPDERFHYLRERDGVPHRMIRACKLRDPASGREGPWLAGMTLNPAAVYEAWCHQRKYVCMIQEVGGRPIRPGETFGAAFVAGYFDSIGEMESVYDRYSGHNSLEANSAGWRLIR